MGPNLVSVYGILTEREKAIAGFIARRQGLTCNRATLAFMPRHKIDYWLKTMPTRNIIIDGVLVTKNAIKVLRHKLKNH